MNSHERAYEGVLLYLHKNGLGDKSPSSSTFSWHPFVAYVKNEITMTTPLPFKLPVYPFLDLA